MVNIDPAKELATLLSAGQPVPSRGLQFSQGTILTWNSDTFENTIDYRGITLPNVPVLAGTDALTYQPGDVVGMLGWSPGGGFGSWWILGRIIVPGSGAAERAVEFMRTALAEAIAASVFADRISSDVVLASDSTSSTSFVSLFSGGPVVNDVQVTEAGRALVFLSGYVAPNDFTGAYMGVSVTGAMTIAPNLVDTLSMQASTDEFISMRASRMLVMENLNAGAYTFQAQFRASGAGPAFFQDPAIAVIAF